MMQEYAGHGGRPSLDECHKALEWLAPERDTTRARQRIDELRSAGELVVCTWTDVPLRPKYQVDHCLRYAAWPNDDLWNLVPSLSETNQEKGDRLPSAEALVAARPRLLDWWRRAYLPGPLRRTFEEEVPSTLPGIGASSEIKAESVFEALMTQRNVLKCDQDLEEWEPARGTGRAWGGPAPAER